MPRPSIVGNVTRRKAVRQQYAGFPEIGGNVKPQLVSARCEFGAGEERQVGMLEHAAQRSREFGAGSSD
jgi:hypothetical protein